MNNNKKNMQPNTASEGDNTINTKKGFLISLPGKKNNSEGMSSGIIPAKTIKDDKKPGRDDTRHNKGEQKRNHNKNRHNNGKAEKPEKTGAPQQKKAPEGNKNDALTSNQPEQKKQDNNQKHHGKNHGKQNKGAKQNGQNQQKNDNNQKKHDKNQKKQIEQNKKNPKEHNNQAKQNGSAEQRQDKHSHDKRNDRIGKGARPIETAGLSPLSRDMKSFSSISTHEIAESAKKTKEPSLEEKYGGLPTLAEQIAAEEEKRKAKPRSMVAEVIDRTKTGNKELAEVAKAAEGNPDIQIKIPDTSKSFEVVGIRFREAGKVYYFDPNGHDIPFGTPVIVETARGAEYGYTAISNRLVPASSVVPPLKKIKRIATGTDTEKYHANKALESDAAEIFKEKVAALGLEMNLVFVEYTFDNSKLLFYFTAETRIDFRELVKELASVFRTRIELRQIGVRDEAKMLGGLGVCGRSICCNSFLGDFAQVSIKMAKDQGLSLNSAKISGACGKLMCCLRYEDKVYEEEMARTPKVGSIVETSEGKGVVIEALPLKGLVKVTLTDTPEIPPKLFERETVKVIGLNKSTLKEEAEEMEKLKSLEDNN